jgi:hypothetical protein
VATEAVSESRLRRADWECSRESPGRIRESRAATATIASSNEITRLQARNAAASPNAEDEEMMGTRTYQPKWMSLKNDHPLEKDLKILRPIRLRRST